MLFQVKDLAADTGTVAAILRAHDANAKIDAHVPWLSKGDDRFMTHLTTHLVRAKPARASGTCRPDNRICADINYVSDNASYSS
jgi:hypothetical protein